MPVTSVLVEDKIAGTPPSEKFKLQLPGDRLVVRELIRLYVAEQVDRFNRRPTESSSRHQSDDERLLNLPSTTRHTQRRDCEAEFDRAVSAFSSNGFFLLVDGLQVNDLDQEITIKCDTEVQFLRLTPLVGG